MSEVDVNVCGIDSKLRLENTKRFMPSGLQRLVVVTI
jgi:hypothetical protein